MYLAPISKTVDGGHIPENSTQNLRPFSMNPEPSIGLDEVKEVNVDCYFTLAHLGYQHVYKYHTSLFEALR